MPQKIKNITKCRIVGIVELEILDEPPGALPPETPGKLFVTAITPTELRQARVEYHDENYRTSNIQKQYGPLD